MHIFSHRFMKCARDLGRQRVGWLGGSLVTIMTYSYYEEVMAMPLQDVAPVECCAPNQQISAERLHGCTDEDGVGEVSSGHKKQP